MKKSLLDTDILSYYLKGNRQVAINVERYLRQYPKITISEINYYEVLAGLAFKQAAKQIEEIERFAATCEILKLSKASLRTSAELYGELRRNGVTIGTADILISGIAVANVLFPLKNWTSYAAILKL